MSYFKKTIKIIIIVVYLEFASAKGVFDSIYNIGLRLDNVLFCNDFWYPKDFFGLKRKLTSDVFGQPFVKNNLIPIVEDYYFKPHPKHRDPLVLSFHGPSGVGKSFVSEMLSSAPFIKNKHVFSSKRDFSDPELTNQYKNELNGVIDSSIKNCERSVFIFEDADYISTEVISSLNAFKNKKDNLKYGESMFIFIFEIGSEEIYATASKLLNNGLKRHQFDMNEFRDSIIERIINKAVPNPNASNGIFLEPINKIIPFLPLEKEHIKTYILVESFEDGYEPTKSDIEKAYELLELHPGTPFFKSGCKLALNKLRLVQAARKSEL